MTLPLFLEKEKISGWEIREVVSTDDRKTIQEWREIYFLPASIVEELVKDIETIVLKSSGYCYREILERLRR